MRCNTDNRGCKAGKIIAGIIFGIGAAFLFGLVIMLLWNELMPHLFDVPLITYWQAFGLALLGRLLFGGVGHSGGNSESKRSARRDRIQKAVVSDKMKDWHYYDKWWNTEGEKSFREYAEKAQENKVEETKEISEK